MSQIHERLARIIARHRGLERGDVGPWLLPEERPGAAAAATRSAAHRESLSGAPEALTAFGQAAQSIRQGRLAGNTPTTNTDEDGTARRRALLDALRNPDRIDGSTAVVNLTTKEN